MTKVMNNLELKSSDDDYKIPDYTASHFSKHFWIPEVNLTVYDYNDIITGEDLVRDYEYFKAVESHETSHRISSKTGTVLTRMYHSELAGAHLFSVNNDLNKSIVCQIVNDALCIRSKVLQEAFACFLTDVQISRVKSDNRTKHDDLNVDYLETIRDEDLKDKNIRKRYDQLHDLWEWSKNDDVFVSSAVLFALDIPYIAPTEDLLTNERLNPEIRFDLVYEQIQKLENKKPLNERYYFSTVVNNSKLFAGEEIQKFISAEAFGMFSYLTNLNFGNLNLDEKRKSEYLWIQFNPSDVAPLPIIPEDNKKKLRRKIDAQFGTAFQKYFLDYLLHFWVACIKIPKSYVYVPNYRYADSASYGKWLSNYWSWLEKDLIIEGRDVDLISRFMGGLFDKDYIKTHKKQLKEVYKKIDFSKVDSLVEEDFRKTSKMVGRQLNW